MTGDDGANLANGLVLEEWMSLALFGGTSAEDYATDQELTFAGMAIAILPPLLLFLVLRRSFIQGLTAGSVRR